MISERSKVTIEMTMEDLAHISLALDRVVLVDENSKTLLEWSPWVKLQKKFDGLYKDLWRSHHSGIKSVIFDE